MLYEVITDFLRVLATEKLRISIPIHFVGEDKSPARHTSGVVIQHQMTDVEVLALSYNFV